MRLFVAVELVDGVREQIARALEPLHALPEAPPGLRWLRPESWHITLQFLGEVQESALDALREACTQAGTAVGAFELVLAGAGAFNPRKARVLWLGTRTGGSECAALAAAVATRTAPLGFEPDERTFNAHVTLARIKPPGDVRPLLPHVQLGPFSQRVTHLSLMRSHLGPHGARYEALLRVPLGSGLPQPPG
jgi:2'-5' RNA ligase